jgi:hypothetical protein
LPFHLIIPTAQLTFSPFCLFNPNSLAQATLVSPLATAAKEARSPFLKSEAFRLLSVLLASKPDPNVSALEKAASSHLHSAADELMGAIECSLKDNEMKKTKRVRIVLKAAEKVVSSLASPCSPGVFSRIGEIKALFQQLEGGESNAIKNICTKLVSDIDKKQEELSAMKEQQAATTPTTPGSGSKKSKKKKKNKK